MKRNIAVALSVAVSVLASQVSLAGDCSQNPQLNVSAINATAVPLVVLAESQEINGSNGALLAAEQKTTLRPNWDPGSPTTFTLTGTAISSPSQGQVVAQCSAVITLPRACPPAKPVAQLRVSGSQAAGYRCTLVAL